MDNESKYLPVSRRVISIKLEKEGGTWNSEHDELAQKIAKGMESILSKILTVGHGEGSASPTGGSALVAPPQTAKSDRDKLKAKLIELKRRLPKQ